MAISWIKTIYNFKDIVVDSTSGLLVLSHSPVIRSEDKHCHRADMWLRFKIITITLADFASVKTTIEGPSVSFKCQC